jgi:hypothetical protein
MRTKAAFKKRKRKVVRHISVNRSPQRPPKMRRLARPEKKTQAIDQLPSSAFHLDYLSSCQGGVPISIGVVEERAAEKVTFEHCCEAVPHRSISCATRCLTQ